MNTLWQDLRYGIRVLLKRPGFTIVTVISLAIGISANTAIFSFVDALLLRPLPFKDLDHLAMAWTTLPQGSDRAQVSPADFVDWKNQNRIIESHNIKAVFR